MNDNMIKMKPRQKTFKKIESSTCAHICTYQCLYTLRGAFSFIEDEGELFPIFRIRKDDQELLVIDPTFDHQRIFSIEIKSTVVKNELGVNLGSTYHQVSIAYLSVK